MNQRRLNLEKQRFWTNLIRRQRQSGLSIRAFCAAESLAEPNFYWWRRELARRKMPRRPEPSTRRQKPAPALAEAAQFVPVTVTPSSPCAVVEVALPGGVIIRVPQGCSQLLREVLAALEANRC